MSRVITDQNLLTWEVYSSGGKWGLPLKPKIVFQCLSDPDSLARFVIHEGTEADAEQAVHQSSDEELRALLARSRTLESGI